MTQEAQYMLIVEVEHDPLLHNEDFMSALSEKLADIVIASGLNPISSGLLIGGMQDIGEGV